MFELLASWATVRASFDAWLDAAARATPRLAAALIVVVLFVVLARAARGSATKALTRVAHDARAGAAWGVLVQYSVLVLGLVVTLTVAGVELAALMVAVGAVAFAVAFAMQDTIANLVSGLILLTSRPIAPGDTVRLDDGITGQVVSVGLRATRLRSADGHRVEVPNRNVLGEAITVLSYHMDQRFELTVGIGYDDDIAGAIDTILRTVRDVEGVEAQPPPEVVADSLGTSTIELKVRFWVDKKPRPPAVTKGEVVRLIKENLDEAGFHLPFPTQTLVVQAQAGSGEGNGGERGEGPRRSRSSSPSERRER